MDTLTPKALKAAERLKALIGRARDLQYKMDKCHHEADKTVERLSIDECRAINALGDACPRIATSDNSPNRVDPRSWGDWLA